MQLKRTSPIYIASGPPAEQRQISPGTPAVSLPAPSVWARQALDFHPDPKQAQILDCADPRVIVLSSRQVGKSTVAAIRALYLAVSNPRTFVLLVGPVGAQAGEILAKASQFAATLGFPLRGDGNNPRSLKLPNGSRIVARPAVPASLRSYSKAQLIIVDEAAWVSESAFQAMSPILAAANGTLWALSTPNGQNGRFYDLWHNAPHNKWTHFEIRAQDCPRFSPEFLAEERSTYGETFFAQEYDCQFLAAGLQFLSRSQIQALLIPAPAVPGPCLAEKSEMYLGLDLGKRQDHTALVAVELTFQNGPKNPVTQGVPLLPILTVRHVDRLALDSPTLNIPRWVRDVAQRFAPSCYAPKQRGTLLVDATGNGHTVVELLQAQPIPNYTTKPICISGGQISHQLKGGYTSVPRADLLTSLKVAIESEKLKLHATAPGMDLLLRELQQFKTAGDQGEHDDLVIALALAVWQAAKSHPGLFGRPEPAPVYPHHRII